ncbi:MAG: hypothetical protein ACLQGJ_12845 [Candidatus Dormibacteria bacterium]
MPSRRRLTALAVFGASTVALALVGTAPVRADGCDDTWTGADSGNWSDANNWNQGTPTSGMALCFPFSVDNMGSSIQDDIAGLTISGLTFGGDGNAVSGSDPLTLSAGASAAGNVNLSSPVVLNGLVAATSSFESADVEFLGPVSGPGGIVGGSNAWLGFSSAGNTFSGGVSVSDGGIRAAPDGSLGTGQVVVNDSPWTSRRVAPSPTPLRSGRVGLTAASRARSW